MPFFGGQLVVPNVERDDGTLEKEFYVVCICKNYQYWGC